jgi:hypothetical protein
VHERPAQFQISQVGGFEPRVIAGLPGDHAASPIFELRADTDVVKSLIGQQGAAVAKRAVKRLEKIAAVFFRDGQLTDSGRVWRCW